MLPVVRGAVVVVLEQVRVHPDRHHMRSPQPHTSHMSGNLQLDPLEHDGVAAHEPCRPAARRADERRAGVDGTCTRQVCVTPALATLSVEVRRFAWSFTW